MNTISNIHMAGQTAAERLHAAREPREASTAPETKPEEKAGEPPVSFEHQVLESAGKYWVAAAQDGPQIRFDKPTSAAAQSSDMKKTTEPQSTAGTEKEGSTAQPAESPAAAHSAEEAKEDMPAARDKAPEEPDEEKEDEKQKSSTTTCNTDAVDRELEMLRSKAQKLEQAARSEGEDSEAQSELENVKRELAMKDNDTYRRAHAHFS